MKDILKIADLIKFYLQHISCNTVANVDHKILSIPTYSDHDCTFSQFSPSLWLWKMNWELECLIFFTQWPLCWILAPEELEVMEIVPGTPDSNHSPDQPPARWQLSAKRTSIIHQYVLNEKFQQPFVNKLHRSSTIHDFRLFFMFFTSKRSFKTFCDIIPFVIFREGYEVHKTKPKEFEFRLTFCSFLRYRKLDYNIFFEFALMERNKWCARLYSDKVNVNFSKNTSL